MRAVVNGEVDRNAVPPPARDAARCHRALADYAPTPVHELPVAAESLGVRAVLVKDESPVRVRLAPSQKAC
jgi:hypothetical protein